MVKNIDKIIVWKTDNDKPNPVRIEFKFPCTWTLLDIEDLKQIIRCWILGEEEKYPKDKGFKGRELLLIEILKVFSESDKNES